MQRRGQTLFLLESLQPDWLPQHWQRWVVQRTLALLFGLPTGLLLGLVGALLNGLGGALGGALVGVLIFQGLRGKAEASIVMEEQITWSWREVRSSARTELRLGVGSMLVAGVV